MTNDERTITYGNLPQKFSQDALDLARIIDSAPGITIATGSPIELAQWLLDARQEAVTKFLSDAALVEEAARRGMSVMDAAQAARLRGVAEGVEKLAVTWDGRSCVIERRSGASSVADVMRAHASALYALLSADDEPEVSA